MQVLQTHKRTKTRKKCRKWHW